MQKKNRLVFMLIACAATCVAGLLWAEKSSFSKVDEKETYTLQSLENALEIPQLPANRKERLLRHTGYAVSFNPEWNIPNWVAYELTEAETYGKRPRTNLFTADPDAPGCPETWDYSSSGWDRGHMAPAGDMKWDTIAMKESFYLSNVCPQNHNLNKGDWNYLEEKVRNMARKYGNVYVCCGPIVTATDSLIGKQHRIVVPQAFFKALLWQTNGQWTAAGFCFRNEAGHRDLKAYALTVDSLEKLTGMDFFPALDDAEENEVESVLDLKFF